MGLNKPSGNMYPWAWTWNPVGGKCPYDCSFCYVSGKIAPWLARMGNDKYLGESRLIEKEFKTKLITPDGKIIFVQSCGDLFAYGIKDEWIQRVLDYISKFPIQTFLLQTKNPERFFDFKIPSNCILGTTIETNRDISYFTKAPSTKERYYTFFQLTFDTDFTGKKIYRLMVSIEPVMDFDLETLLLWMREISPEFVSIGADSGNNNLPEPHSVKLQEFIECLKNTTEVRLKENLNRLLTVHRRRRK